MIKKLIILFIVIGAVAGGFFFYNASKRKQVLNKNYRVGILSGVAPFATISDGFKERMAELGYVEGKNITYDFQKLSPSPAGYKKEIQKFIDDKVDLMFVFPTEPAAEARELTKGTDIPVVFSIGTLEDVELVDSIQKPGANLTGIRYPGPELTVKRFDLLRELKPDMKTLYIAYNPNYPAVKSALKALLPAAESAGIKVVEDQVPTVADLNRVLAKYPKVNSGLDAILIMPETVVQSPDGWAAINKFASDRKIPIGGSISFQADAGAVFTYIPNNIEMGRTAANLVDKIFNGQKPGDISVVTPESELRFNYKVAQELGLTVSEGLLRRADEVIR